MRTAGRSLIGSGREGCQWLLALVSIVAVAIPAHAKLPELDAVYWGSLSHNTNQPLIPSYTGQIIVSAQLDGITIAEHSVPAGDNEYVLKIPMDDGDEPRVPGTVRASEQIRVYVRNLDLDLEFETRETGTDPFGVSPIKGDIQTQDLSVTGNLSTAGQLQAAFAVWAGDFEPAPDITIPDGDADSDGISNFDEFLADTDPLSASSRLQIFEFLHQDTIASVRFGPVRLSRNYTLHGSADLTEWQPITQLRPDSDGEFAWLNHVASDSPYRYYRIAVDLE